MALRSAAAGRPGASSSSADAPSSLGRLRYASFEARIAAGALDSLVLFIITALLVMAGSLVILISSDFERQEPSDTAIALFVASVASIVPAFLLYFFVSFCWKGQTIGHAVLGLMVLRSDTRRLGVLGALARVVVLLVYPLMLTLGGLAAYLAKDSTTLAGGIIAITLLAILAGFFWAAFDPHRRALHDRIAATIVVRAAV